MKRIRYSESKEEIIEEIPEDPQEIACDSDKKKKDNTIRKIIKEIYK